MAEPVALRLVGLKAEQYNGHVARLCGSEEDGRVPVFVYALQRSIRVRLANTAPALELNTAPALALLDALLAGLARDELLLALKDYCLFREVYKV